MADRDLTAAAERYLKAREESVMFMRAMMMAMVPLAMYAGASNAQPYTSSDVESSEDEDEDEGPARIEEQEVSFPRSIKLVRQSAGSACVMMERIFKTDLLPAELPCSYQYLIFQVDVQDEDGSSKESVSML